MSISVKALILCSICSGICKTAVLGSLDSDGSTIAKDDAVHEFNKEGGNSVSVRTCWGAKRGDEACVL